MCGIVYSYNFQGKPVAQTIISRFQDQRNRGTSGFGFYDPKKNRLTHNVREGRILSLVRRNKANEILFHHRYPTSTANVRNACHPFSTKDAYKHNYILVHNGVLSNEDTLKERHYKEGIEYVSMQDNGRYNDSEALTHDVAQYIEGKVDKLTAKGSIAFIVIQRDKKGRKKNLYFARNSGNPLKIKQTAFSLTLSSEGEGLMVQENMLHRYNYKTKKMDKTPLEVPTTYKPYANYGRPYSSPYGEYGGYNQGYNWREDDEMKDWNKSFGYDEDGKPIKGSVIKGEDKAKAAQLFLEGPSDDYEVRQYERSMVKEVVDKWMYECYENSDNALGLGHDTLDELRIRMAELDIKSDNETITDAEINEYCEIDDQEYLLEQAIAYLEKEVQRSQASVGFRIAQGEAAANSPLHVEEVLSRTAREEKARQDIVDVLSTLDEGDSK